jgi:exonuclease VII large subunit
LLDPQNILRRGYSILRIDGKAVTSATEIKSGDHMDVESYNFTVAGIVEEIKEKKK